VPMSDKVNRRALAGLAAFVSAVSVGRARGAATFKITQRISSATRAMAVSQALRAGSQSKKVASLNAASNAWPHLGTADRAFVLSTGFVAGAKLTSKAAKHFGRVVGAPIAAEQAASIDRFAKPPVASVSKAFISVIATLGESIGAATLRGSASFPAIGAAETGSARSAFLIWRTWSTIVLAIYKAAAALSHGASIILDGTTETFELMSDEATRRGTNADRLAPASSALVAVAASLRSGTIANVIRGRFGNGFRSGRESARKAAAIAIVSSPLFAAPAMATIPADRPKVNTGRSASVVSNSTPTIVINSNEPAAIELRVVEALDKHREAIYEQWHRELQRRQRTEF
jgi:hypothetical protein